MYRIQGAPLINLSFFVDSLKELHKTEPSLQKNSQGPASAPDSAAHSRASTISVKKPAPGADLSQSSIKDDSKSKFKMFKKDKEAKAK